MNFHSVVRKAVDAKGTLVLMHGLGSDEQDMFGLAHQLNEHVEVICLRAPHSYGPGYAWFDIQWTPQGIQVDPNQVGESVVEVAKFLGELERPNLLVGGFSQGAMMALGTVHQIPELLTGALLLSGRGIDAGCPEFGGSIFQAHGLQDEVISIREARTLNEALKGLGDRYEYHEYEMGHWINEQELDDLNQWLARTLDIK